MNTPGLIKTEQKVPPFFSIINLFLKENSDSNSLCGQDYILSQIGDCVGDYETSRL